MTAEKSPDNGVILVTVHGSITRKDEIVRNFVQILFLDPKKDDGYFILNDAFTNVENVVPSQQLKGTTKFLDQSSKFRNGKKPVTKEHCM